MFEVETADAEPGTVVQVVQDGYLLHDRLLRPAMVGVAKAPAAQEEEPSVPGVPRRATSQADGESGGAPVVATAVVAAAHFFMRNCIRKPTAFEA